MSPRPSSLVKHHFVCASGVPLPRWQEAFPSATVSSPASLARRIPASGLVWLRLDSSRPVPEQLTGLGGLREGTKVIALSDHPDDEEALSLFSIGVRGYCNAHATAANLRRVAEVVQAGGLWIGEALMARLVAATTSALAAPRGADPSQAGDGPAAARLSLLSPREQEVARMVAGGHSNKEIARRLDITERTVKAHVGAIFQKLDVRDRLQLALVVNGRQIT